MTYKISYPDNWDKDCTHYDQKITIRFGEREATRCNVLSPGRLLERMDDDGILFTNLHERDFFVDHFHIRGDKRFLDRNTVFKFIAI